MSTVQIKRRSSGSTGAPASLKSGEPAWSAPDQTLYVGSGDDGSGNATSVVGVGGRGLALQSGETLQSLVNRNGGFATRAAFVSASSYPWTAGAVVAADGQQYEYDGSTTSITDLSGWKPFGAPTPQHWGFVADQSTGQTAAFQAAMTYCHVNSLKLFMPPGDYLLEDEITCYYVTDRTQPYGIIGAGRDVTRIWYNFDDPTKTVLNFTRNDGTFQSYNQSDKEIGGFSVFRLGGDEDVAPGPCVLDVSGLGNSRVHEVYIGNNNNTSIRGSRNANLVMDNIYANGGGYAFPTVDTTGLTVSGSSGSPTLTISGGTPALAAHVGMTIYIAGLSPRPVVATIAAAPTSGSYTLTENLPQTVSGKDFYFGPPLVTGTSGGGTLTANVATFSSAQVGLFAYVKLDGGGVQRVKITGYTSPTQVSISCAKDTGDPTSTAATLPDDVTSSEIITGHIDFSDRLSRGTGLTDITNDIAFNTCSFHRGAGVQMVMTDVVRVRASDLKLHGFGDPITANSYPHSAMWADNVTFSLDGQVDSNYVARSRLRFFRLKDNGVNIVDLFSTCESGSHIVEVDAQTSDGMVVLQALRGAAESFDEVFLDHGSPVRSYFTGLMYDASGTPIMVGDYDSRFRDIQARHIEIGYGNATGGAGTGRLYGSSDVLSIAPTNMAGGYNFGKELRFDAAGDATWQIEGGAIIPKVFLGSIGGPQIRYGTGSPEGVLASPVGSVYLRVDGGSSTSFYVKESGTGNTGWAAK